MTQRIISDKAHTGKPLSSELGGFNIAQSVKIGTDEGLPFAFTIFNIFPSVLNVAVVSCPLLLAEVLVNE